MTQEDRKLLKMSKEEYEKLNKNNEAVKAILSGISSMPPKAEEGPDYSNIGMP